MHAASRKPLVIPRTAGVRLADPYGPAITGREAGHVNAAPSCREGGGVPIRLVALNTGAATAAPGFCGADRGYSFVSMSHHTAGGKARPVMG